MGKTKKKHSKSNSSVSLKKKRKSSQKKIRTDIFAIFLRIYPDKISKISFIKPAVVAGSYTINFSIGTMKFRKST